MARGKGREETTMRLLRRVLLGVTLLVVIVTGVTWERELRLFDYIKNDAYSIHLEGVRAKTIEVRGSHWQPEGLSRGCVYRSLLASE
jgi:hypothetical protein